ncbi:DNA-binding IscR family transcriptional regulator [Aureimonas phyllosphaerae]|uniref:DNA-binding IscR family transcriptional regulator n=2 Tax=Aureimonas phyllosphaerae TaxID=1166078 RepID=A0A7W6FVQ7_9HYPH|nr:DNA-binding IscR family transcriptional regulator [Aureimonas phyllosphaerae]MBB3960820.1 DNA-binding IscR family transcriptional regulator [Aureimonas phyllosphaerae]
MSRILHVLIHLDRHVPLATSDEISRMISTNPVVVRRMMGGLRDRGIVSSEKGHGGGWQLARPLADVTLRDVYEAVGAPPLFNIGSGAEPSECLVERAVDARLDASLREAEARLLEQFSQVTVEDVARDFERDTTSRGGDSGCSGGGPSHKLGNGTM